MYIYLYIYKDTIQEDGTNLNMDATSMIRGMSSEKPALDLALCIDIA